MKVYPYIFFIWCFYGALFAQKNTSPPSSGVVEKATPALDALPQPTNQPSAPPAALPSQAPPPPTPPAKVAPPVKASPQPKWPTALELSEKSESVVHGEWNESFKAIVKEAETIGNQIKAVVKNINKMRSGVYNKYLSMDKKLDSLLQSTSVLYGQYKKRIALFKKHSHPHRRMGKE